MMDKFKEMYEMLVAKLEEENPMILENLIE
jgi:hypothetical protein